MFLLHAHILRLLVQVPFLKKRRRMKRFLSVFAGMTFFIASVFVPTGVFAVEENEVLSLEEIEEFTSDLNRLTAIPLEEAKMMVKQLDKDAGVIVGVGFEFGDERNGKYVPVVQKVMKGRPAEKAGMREGDVVLSVNGKLFTTPEALVAEVRGDGIAGKTVTLEIDRNGVKVQMSIVTVVLRPDRNEAKKKLKEEIAAESAAYAVKIADVVKVLVNDLETNQKVTLKNSPIVAALNQIMLEYDEWVKKKNDGISRLLAVE